MNGDKLWNSNFIKICIGNFLIKFSFTLIVPLLPLYLSETFGANNDTIGIILSCYTIMIILVSPFSGYIVDSFPRKAILLLCNFVFFALFAGYIAAGSLTVFAIFRTIHGAPFGTAVVSMNTVAIDVLPSSRRTEGISYFGLSNNLATALGPFAAVFVLKAAGGNYQMLFLFSMIMSLVALIVNSTIKLERRDCRTADKKVISLDRFFLVKGARQAVNIMCFSFCYGVVSTYVAIYGKEELGITSGTGFWFLFFAIGLMVSRLTGAKGLKENKISKNTAEGILASIVGLLPVRRSTHRVGVLLGPIHHRSGERAHVPGIPEHVRESGAQFPERYGQFFHADVLGGWRGVGRIGRRCGQRPFGLPLRVLGGIGRELHRSGDVLYGKPLALREE